MVVESNGAGKSVSDDAAVPVPEALSAHCFPGTCKLLSQRQDRHRLPSKVVLLQIFWNRIEPGLELFSKELLLGSKVFRICPPTRSKTTRLLPRLLPSLSPH